MLEKGCDVQRTPERTLAAAKVESREQERRQFGAVCGILEQQRVV